MSINPDRDPLDIPVPGAVTDDALLGGRLQLLQPEDGYRVGKSVV